MIHKRSYKKRKSIHKTSRRKINKKYQLSGGSNGISSIPNLTEIDSLIQQINIAAIDNTLIELEKYANIMTIQQTYDFINQLGYSASQSIDTYERFTKFPNIFKNIEILINDLLPYYGINMPDLNKKYDRFPISKINVKLCENDVNLVTKLFRYDNHTYKEFSRGGYGFVYGNTITNQAIKRIKWNVKTEPDIFKNEAIHYNDISSLPCNSNYFCKFKNCFIETEIKRSNIPTIYILMEYCGKDLYKTVKDLTISQELSFETLIKWFITIAKGIKCMHDNGYVHLDIKSPNITIHNNEAKLIDFGLTQYITDIKTPIDYGTVGFKAPEMINNRTNIDYRKCDIYSLGVTFASCISERYKSFFNEKDKNIPSFIGLESMISTEPAHRPSIQDVIRQLMSLSKNTFIRNLKKAGFSVDDLIKEGFMLIEIFKGGYTYGEIQAIYKYNTKPYKVLGELLKHCDKNWNYLKRHTSKECTIDTICLSNPLLDDCSDHSINVNIRRNSSRSRSKSSRSRSRSSRSRSKSSSSRSKSSRSRSKSISTDVIIDV